MAHAQELFFAEGRVEFPQLVCSIAAPTFFGFGHGQKQNIITVRISWDDSAGPIQYTTTDLASIGRVSPLGAQVYITCSDLKNDEEALSCAAFQAVILQALIF